MMVPDQSHINRIREALWQHSASVMVGAGFSCNAREAGPDARKFPLWSEIATELCTKLYPSADGNRLKKALKEASGTSGFLRLAQEYQAAFGRVALHSFIRKIVPDGDYVPDDLHRRLLMLPWRDVFTTNWDTLLERTRKDVFDRTYAVVRTLEELPTSTRPRIVKLHGSFPAHFPLVFTEEDYRTYPNKLAPFVNTVQQAMIETVFCLIGFSGDDPNFLQWSGWVRDNLGESTPKIYLAGWLDLSPHRRRMLEDRNVVPIDLARHPKANTWQEHLRHKYATDWILHTLEHGEPYNAPNWPKPPGEGRSLVPDHLQPVEDVKVNAPERPPDPPFGGEKNRDHQEKVRAVIKVWEHNRKVYPGWLAIPPNKHLLLGTKLHLWEHTILQTIPSLLPLERLSALREFVWLKEKLLEPFSDQVEEAIQAVLDIIDCEARKIDGVGVEERSVDWVQIRAAWRNLALSLLTAARQRFDRDIFDRRLTALTPFLSDHTDVSQRSHYERCLWAIYDLDLEALYKVLEEWRPEDCDPVWIMRKAALLFEYGKEEEAVRLLSLALSTIREEVRQGNSLAGPSREGWALWMALGLNDGFSQKTSNPLMDPPVWERWKKLAPLQCDAFAQKRDIFKALRGDPEKEDEPLFDLGVRRGDTINLSNTGYERWINARRVLRLCEVAALPPISVNLNVAKDILEVAAETLVTTDYRLASRLALRLATDEKNPSFNRIWSRSRIAAMPMEDATYLSERVSNRIEYILSKGSFSGQHSNFGIGRLRTDMEALSRLVLRLQTEQAERIFIRSLDYYRLSSIAKHPWLTDVTKHLLARSWEALSKQSKGSLILDILDSPIVGLDGFESFDDRYPDPGLLPNVDIKMYVPKRLPATDWRWAAIVQLIARGLSCTGEARSRAASRLILLVFLDRVATSEEGLLAHALWHPDHTDGKHLPDGTSLQDWVFLLLPEPEDGIARQLFQEKWFGSPSPKGQTSLDEYIGHVGNALLRLHEHNIRLNLAEREHTNLVAIIENWADASIPQTNDPFSKVQLISKIRDSIAGLAAILVKIAFPPNVGNKLFDKMYALSQRGIVCYQLSAGLAKLCPDRLEEITNLMRIGLASDKVEVAEKAVLGLDFWLKAMNNGSDLIPAPPSELLQEIGFIIATRRKGVLIWALKLARWIFSSGSSDQKNTIAQPVLHGLAYLIEELSYDREHDGASYEELPLLRWGCAHLALAMSASGYETNETIIRWVEVSQKDPLPEVRNAERPDQAFTN